MSYLLKLWEMLKCSHLTQVRSIVAMEVLLLM